MVRSVVLDQINTIPSFGEGRHQRVLKKADVCRGIEVIDLVLIGKLAGVQRYRAKYLLRVAFTPGENLGLGIQRSPSAV